MTSLFAPTIVVNNTAVAIKPNSFTYTEGFGERKVRVASTGGGQTTQIFSDDIETQMSTCKFMLYTTSDNVDLVRGWQANGSVNAIEVTDKDGFTRTFLQALITNDPEVALGVDGEVEVEFTTKRTISTAN